VAYEFYISITGAKQGKFKGDDAGEKGAPEKHPAEAVSTYVAR